MEAIKKLLRPGAAEDDQTLYGQGNSTNTTDATHQKAGLTGEGSHLSGNKEQTSLPGQTTSTSQHAAGGLTGQGSHLSGARDNTTFGQHQSSGLSYGTSDLTSGRETLSQPGQQQYPINSGASGINTQSGSTTTPHNSSLLNKADPRIDSDKINLGGSGSHSGRDVGIVGGSSSLGNQQRYLNTESSRGNTTLASAVGVGSNSNTTQGPHNSNLLNKLDPRVDSDNSKTINSGAGSSGYGSTTGGSYHTGPTGSAFSGPHQTATANKLDPNLDSSPSMAQEDAIHHDEKHGGGAEEADIHHGGSGKAGAAGAVGLGAIGLGSQSHPSRFTERGAGSYDAGNQSAMPGSYPESLSNTGNDSQTGVGAQHLGATGSHNTSTSIPDRTRTTNDPIRSDGEKEHQYGRDAALVGGAAGLGGVAYGASRHSSTEVSQPIHQSDSLNRADPRVDTTHSQGGAFGSNPVDRSRDIMTGDTTSHQTATTTLHDSNLATRADSTVDNDQTRQHHHGRDAGLGAGAVGAVGAGYGLGQHGNQPHSTSTTTTTTTSTSQSTAGPHSSDLANRADPRVDSDRSKEQNKDHNYGRNAAITGGGLGAAAYGAHKYNERDEKDLKRAEEERAKQLKDAEKDRKHAEKEQHHAQKEHEKAVHEHEKHEKERAHDQKERDKAVLAAEKDRKHAEKEHEKQLRDNDKHDTKDEKHAEKKEHKGLFSFLHRDKNKKYSKEEEDEFDRQERDHNSRNVAGGAAVAGAGAYAAHQYHSGHKDSVSDNPASSTKDHKGTPLAEKPVGTAIGDKLHGPGRNRGVPGPTGFPDGGEPDVSINQHTGEPLATGHAADHSYGQGERKKSLGDVLHGTERNRGHPGTTGFPEGGGPNDGINHHTGEKLATGAGVGAGVGAGAGALVHEHGDRKQSVGDYNTNRDGNLVAASSQQAPAAYATSGQHSSTHGTTHDNDRSQAGILGGHHSSTTHDNDPSQTSAYGTSQHSSTGRDTNTNTNILSPTTDEYSHSSTHPSSSTTAQNTSSAAPRHLTSEQKADASGDGILDSNSGVKTDQGVATGESHGVATAVGNDGRNRLHKDPPITRFN